MGGSILCRLSRHVGGRSSVSNELAEWAMAMVGYLLQKPWSGEIRMVDLMPNHDLSFAVQLLSNITELKFEVGTTDLRKEPAPMECPHGHVFGFQCDMHADCDTCVAWRDCYAARPPIDRQRSS